MRYMILVKATMDSEAAKMPTEEQLREMAEYHEQLHRAGVVLDASGLRPSKDGFRVQYSQGRRTIVDGPFAETKELIAGYTIIQVKSPEEAKEWARRFPMPYVGYDDVHIEVRRMWELEDFVQGDGVAKFREMGLGEGPREGAA